MDKAKHIKRLTHLLGEALGIYQLLMINSESEIERNEWVKDLSHVQSAKNYLMVRAEEFTNMDFNKRETAVILAGLRLLQRVPVDERDGIEHFFEVEPLNDEEIDDLCERINFGGK
jgi:hypothetical protein